MTGFDFSDVGLVLVEYQSRGLVAERARQLDDWGCNVVVADNSNTYDGPGLVHKTGRNLGFGLACNAAVDRLPPHVRIIVLHNPDATLEVASLAALVQAVRDGWSAVAPALRGSSYRPYGFAKPGPVREVWLSVRELAGLFRRSDSPHAPGHVQSRRGRRAFSTVQIRGRRFGSAAVLALDREAFKDVGGFSPAYFLYVEDLDLWTQLERAGYAVGFAPEVVVEHVGASGSEASGPRRVALRWLGREIFAWRHRRWSYPFVRMIHQFLMRWFPEDDPVVRSIRRSYREGEHPVRVNERLREGDTSPQTTQTVRAGWSRSRLRITSGARVLDVGSGAFPNPRADVLCERDPVRPHRRAVVDRPFVVADATALPFRRGAFDHVIASHLAEHVADPRALCAELGRVAVAGYIETPSPLFEKLLPEENHLWRVSRPRPGLAQFERNFGRRPAVLQRIGPWLHTIYYADRIPRGQGFGASALRAVGWMAVLLRAAANRSHVSVTTIHFGPEAPLQCAVEGGDYRTTP